MLSEKRLIKVQSLATILLFLALIVASTYYVIQPEMFDILTTEDGIIENTTALFLLLCAIISAIHFFTMRKEKSVWWSIVTMGIVVVAFFIFGEEISWGQRIFDRGSSQFFKSFNTQEETNLHNLSINGFRINQWIFGNLLSVGMGVYFLVFVPLYKRNRKFASFADYMGIPVPRINHTIDILISATIVMIMTRSGRWELLELAFVLVIFMVLIYPQNKEQVYTPTQG